jgi:exosortase
MSTNLARLTSPTTLFAAFTVCLIAAFSGVLRALVAFASGNETASHVVGVPLVSIVLIYTNREFIFASIKAAPGFGAIVGVTGLALAVASGWLASDAQNVLSLRVAGFALAWAGGFIACFGPAAARAALFPLAFLAFMVPPPAALIDAATNVLKVGSTEAVAALFSLTGTPYHRQGFVFALPSVVIEIADECSGIRSSIALLLTSLLAGQAFLRSSWTKILLLLAILPVALLKNAIRIVSLTLLAIHVDPSFLTGQLHHEGGIVFFLLSLALLAPLFAALRWSEMRGEPRTA